MSRGNSRLSRRLDGEVYQIVRKLLDDESSTLTKPDVASIYSMIQRSNSSLKRTPKRLLEDSIQRVLDTLEDVKFDSDTIEECEVEKENENTQDIGNALNRSIVQAWNFTNDQSSKTQPKYTVATSKHSSTKHKIETSQDLPDKRLKRIKTDVTDLSPPKGLRLEDIAGIDSILDQCNDILIGPLLDSRRHHNANLHSPRGVLFHGPPGCGKTMLCEALAAELDLPFQYISAPSIISGISGDSEKMLREKFELAVKIAPSIMFIDEIDAITPKRDSTQREMDRRIVAQLLTCLDNLAMSKTGGKPVILLAATNRPDSLDPALRRAGRFDIEIEMAMPNIEQREAILLAMTRHSLNIGSDVDFKRLAKLTSGYVGADLKSLLSNATKILERRFAQTLHDRYNHLVDPHIIDSASEKQLSPAVLNFKRQVAIWKLGLVPDKLENFNNEITMDDFMKALSMVQPSAKREGFATTPDTSWADIGALEDVRTALQDRFIAPIMDPEGFAYYNVPFPSGVLLWGPPGCGKTMLAKAVANQCNTSFIAIKGPELLNKYVGESERAVRQVFSRARSAAPCLIFFDEVDALLPKRSDMHSEATERVVNQLLTELDGTDPRKGVYVIAATNRPDRLDPAILRGGRIESHFYVGLPGADERSEIVKTLLRGTPIEPGAAESIAKSERCEGFSGADLQQLVAQAGMMALKRASKLLCLDDFHQALEKVQPSVTKDEIKRFERLKTTLMSDFRG